LGTPPFKQEYKGAIEKSQEKNQLNSKIMLDNRTELIYILIKLKNKSTATQKGDGER